MKARFICYAAAVVGLVLFAADLSAAPEKSGKNAGKEPAKVEIGGQVRHAFLGASYHGKIFFVDKDGKVEWDYPAPNCQDVFLLDDGSILFNTRNSAKIVNRDKKVLWEYKPRGKCEVHSCAPLGGGNVLMTLSGQSRVIEVDRKGKVVKDLDLNAVSKKAHNAHMELRDSAKTARGTYLVAFLNEGLVRELDAAGKVLRTIAPAEGKPNTVSSIVPLPGGNLLIGTGYGRSVVEVDAGGKVVWSLTEKDVPGLGMGYVAAAVRLPGGNTLVSCYKGTYAFFEITKDKKIVWSIKGGPFHGCTAIQVLD